MPVEELKTDLRNYFSATRATMPAIDIALRGRSVATELQNPAGLQIHTRPFEMGLEGILRSHAGEMSQLDEFLTTAAILQEFAQPESKTTTSGTGPAPTMTGLVPPSASIGYPDIELLVQGTGFTPSSRIFFNGGEEPTKYYSSTQISTTIKPSTATTPGSYPVEVRAGSQVAGPQQFEFLDSAPPAGGVPLPPIITQTSTGPVEEGNEVATIAQPAWGTASGPFTYVLADNPEGLFTIYGNVIRAAADIPDSVHFLTVTSGNASGTSEANGAWLNFEEA